MKTYRVQITAGGETWDFPSLINANSEDEAISIASIEASIEYDFDIDIDSISAWEV